MNTTFLIDGRLVFDCGQNALASLVHPDITENLNEPCARCLETLLAAQGNIVSQAELYKAGWGESYKEVSPNTLYQNILLARKAFRKVADSDEDFIITVPRQGFRFNETLAVTISNTQDNCAPVPEILPSELHNDGGENVLPSLMTSPLLLRLAIPVSVLLILLSAMIFMFSTFYYANTTHNDLTTDYNYVGNLAGCDIYINKRQTLSGLNAEQIQNKWPDIFSGCDRLPQRYVTPYRNHLSVFYLSCNNINKADRICSSGYRRLSE
ncbi:TPA: winged helix-turn-helix domain-containing protein [Klebsiella pneumoniae subsp. pneumoniae]|nr:winged helix-turn-helix domain-containing protein [Klebsiella pneumoniae subsp. pneumoniae]